MAERGNAIERNPGQRSEKLADERFGCESRPSARSYSSPPRTGTRSTAVYDAFELFLQYMRCGKNRRLWRRYFAIFEDDIHICESLKGLLVRILGYLRALMLFGLSRPPHSPRIDSPRCLPS